MDIFNFLNANVIMKISLVFLGTTGAGPVYSLEMARALYESKRCHLQVIISENITNKVQWVNYFSQCQDVDFHIIETYAHTSLSVLKTLYFDFEKKRYLVDLIKGFQSEILYLPFGLMWSNYVFRRLHDNVRIISTIHDPHPHDSMFGGFKWFLLRILSDRGQDRLVNDVVILNKKDVDFVQRKFCKNVCVIPHASFHYYVKEQCNYGIKYKIGFFGRIEPYKGLDLLVEAFEHQENKNLKLLIAGSGAIDSYLKSRIESNSNIELINRYIEDDEFQELINQIDFVVLPYKRASQSGVIPMSFAFGKTVISTRVGALEEQIPEGTGVLVEPNSSAISEAITKLYSMPSDIVKMGKSAQLYAQTELTWAHSADLLLNYLSN